MMISYAKTHGIPVRILGSAPQIQLMFSSSSKTNTTKSLITGNNSVHSNMKVDTAAWRNKPLFRRQGDVRFKTGTEAAQLLVQEARRRDAHHTQFIQNVQAVLHTLAPLFDRNPKYAFVAKQLLEPERHVEFRVAWIDDVGVVRMNRGYRIQYNSSLGNYAGALHFGGFMTNDTAKSLAWQAVFANALTNAGAAVGGSDFVPEDKSDAELQRFCQSYVTELAKYIGPSIDTPWMGAGVGRMEMGYLFGQYKRLNPSAAGQSFLSGDSHEVPGYSAAFLANEMLADKGDALEGKRCLILGSGKRALSLADKLVELGAIPISFSDPSGFVYEPEGFGTGSLRTINNIKSDRGALLGRYIIHSTTAQFNQPASIFDIPCDVCFPCDPGMTLSTGAIASLADAGCRAVIEGVSAVDPAAFPTLKQRGMLYGPHTLTAGIIAGCTADPAHSPPVCVQSQIQTLYHDVKRTASEFNARGDLFAGANILSFVRVANKMMKHGAV